MLILLSITFVFSILSNQLVKASDKFVANTFHIIDICFLSIFCTSTTSSLGEFSNISSSRSLQISKTVYEQLSSSIKYFATPTYPRGITVVIISS